MAAAALAAGVVVAGCALPGAPQPPSLNLPQPVNDLAAARAGNQVSLHWTMPARNTDRTLIKGKVNVRICRKEGASSCATAGSLLLECDTAGTFNETLPPALASGSPRALTYFVELKNGKGRSAGLSNGAIVLAGQAPSAVTGLRAEMAPSGVILRWNSVPAAQEPGPTAVRLQRTLIASAPAKAASGPFTPPREPPVQNLLVPAGSEGGVVLDKNIRFGETYEYRAERFQTETVDGHALQLSSALSPPVRIHAVNAFPPGVPTGLVAVATPAHNGIPPSIDLSWQPDVESGIAGYVVYRRQNDHEPWQRISPAQPVFGPAFEDHHVLQGEKYHYAVSAVGTDGLESARSAEAQETVPGP
jgi:hypothetical protein